MTSLTSIDPFEQREELHRLALEHNAKSKIIDLSIGDTRFSQSASTRSREFHSFLSLLDTKFNRADRSFANADHGHEGAFLEEIAGWVRSTYVPAIAERYLKDLSEFIQRSIIIAEDQGYDWSPFDVMEQIFDGSLCSGGSYHDPQGELLTRLILAEHYKKQITHPFNYDDIVLTMGASHAMGSLLKLLGQEGIQHLSTGDKVLTTSPLFSTYIKALEARGIQVVQLDTDLYSGEIDPRSVDTLKKLKGVKMVLILNPGNPSGLKMSDSALKYLGQFAEDQGALIITDEVYAEFMEDMTSMIDLYPKRTLRIHSLSKIERSSGLRLGSLMITKEANDHLTHTILKGKLSSGQDFKTAFIKAKAPGGIQGEFQLTCFPPGPSQSLGMAHLLLGEDSRQDYIDLIKENTTVFCNTLSLEPIQARYFILFDLNDIEGTTKKEVPLDQKIVELAKRGVVLMSANMFFSKQDRETTDRKNVVRACLANGDPETIQRAARIIRDYLIS